MAGFTRRSKPLKGVVALADFDDFVISNPQDDDLLVYDTGTSSWVNTKSLTGNYTISGSLTVNTIVLSEGITLGSNITATGDLDIGGNGEIDGTLLVGSALTADSLSVTAAALIGTTLGVTGALTGSAFSFSGNGTVGGNLTVTGTLSADGISSSSLSPTGDLSVGGTATVVGVTTLQSDLNVLGTLSGADIAGSQIASSGDLTFSLGLYGPRFNLTRAAPNITLALTTDDESYIITGSHNPGSGSVTRTMLDLDPGTGGGVLAYAEGTLELSVLTGNVLVANALEIDGDLNHDGSNIGFFGTAPTTQATAYTQTYSTADKTHAAETTADISLTYTSNDPTITPDGSITIADGAAPTINEYLEWLEELTDQQIKQRADVADLKQLVNSIIDDLQAYGLLQ